MDEHRHRTDSAALALVGQRIAQHRLEQNRTQAELAKEAGVFKRTIERLEGGESTQLTQRCVHHASRRAEVQRRRTA